MDIKGKNLKIEDILINENWKEFNLKMNKVGFDIFSNEVIALNETIPQIYVHISIDKNFEKEILRIGSAKNGIINRWIKSTNGHASTFLYSIAESERYKKYASKYSNYLLFFAELKNLNTKLYVLDCQTSEFMKSYEKELIKYFNPIWEQFKQPIKKYLKENPYIREQVLCSGGVMQIIENNLSDLPHIKNFKSNVKWSLNNKTLEEK
jgi:hypothetical protein